MKITLVSISLLMFSRLAIAGGKSYAFVFDQKMSEEACYLKAGAVAADSALTLLPPNSSGAFTLAEPDGGPAGVAYYAQGVCHIYIY